MSVPSVVVFDLGKVLVDFDYGISAARIARRAKLTPEELRRMLDHSPLLFRLETGLMTNEEFAVEVCAGCGFSGTLDEFYETFADIFSEIKPMIALHAALRAKGVPTCIFSNTNGLAVSHIRQRFPFFAKFDNYILSYEQGSMKPDQKIYAAVESATGHAGEAIVYLDDRVENVEGGLARGWRGILHETPEKSIATLREMGLPVGVNP
jgi:HAD superfamily hydrolase (TIGR01509 family)